MFEVKQCCNLICAVFLYNAWRRLSDIPRHRGEVVHEAGGSPPLRRVSARGRSVLALGALAPAAPPAPAQPAPRQARALPGGAAHAYLSAARYVTGSRIDTSLFRALPLRTHRGKTAHFVLRGVAGVQFRS